MTLEFSSNIALLGFGIAYIGVYVAVCVTEQLRGIFLKYRNPTFLQKTPWIMLNGICVGIISFWGMNYVGFSGMTLKDDQGNIVPITFNPLLAIFALLSGFTGQVIGIFIACNDRFYAKSKAEILDFFVETRSFQEILSYSESYVTFLLISQEITHSLVGGISSSIGLTGVYFIGLASLEFPGYITYNGGIIFAALFIGFSSLISAYWLFFRLLSIFPNSELIRIAVAVAAGIAVSGIHYTAMVGTTFHIDYSMSTKLSWNIDSMTSDQVLYPVLLGAMVILWLISMIVFADLRTKINAYRTNLQKQSPNEKLSDLVLTVENPSADRKARQGHVLKNNTVTVAPPLTFNNYDESPL